MKPLKIKSCRWCKGEFQPRNSLQTCCKIPCAINYTIAKQLKAEQRKEREEQAETNRSHREAKERLRTRSDHLALAQMAFNKYIRLRDEKYCRDRGEWILCISCQKPPKKKNCGHYKSRGAEPSLRFHEDNAHLQCEHCNSYLSGNQVEYRKYLIEKIGLERVEWLEGPHPPLKLTIPEIIEIKKRYSKLARQLEKEL